MYGGGLSLFSLDCLSLGFTLICLTVAGGLLGL